MDLMKRFGDFDKDKNWRAKPEHSDEFLEKWNAALAEEVEVATSQIHTSVLGQGNAYFSVSELLCLTPFLKEDAPSHEPSSSVH
jgi:hypothetical protein